MRFRLRCPHCRNRMLFERRSKGLLLTDSRKRCVYCGKSFQALKHAVKQD